jgi:hypothetical protein
MSGIGNEVQDLSSSPEDRDNSFKSKYFFNGQLDNIATYTSMECLGIGNFY